MAEVTIELSSEIERVETKIVDLVFELVILYRWGDYLRAIEKQEQPKIRRRKLGVPRKESLAAYCQKALLEAGSQLTVSQLVDRIKTYGFTTKAKVPLNNLVPSALVRRPDIFVRVTHGVYRLKNNESKANRPKT